VNGAAQENIEFPRRSFEEPDVWPTSPVPWELGEGNFPWLPDPISSNNNSYIVRDASK
jgi:hypothetical protein